MNNFPICALLTRTLTTGTMLCALSLLGCGGGGSGSSGGGGGAPSSPPPDFSVSVQPTAVSIVPGASVSILVAVSGANGFNSQVSISVSGLPTAVAAAPSQFSLGPGGQQTVVLTAAATAAFGTASISVSASSGALQRAGQIGLAINDPVVAEHPPFRTRYVRTDARWDVAFLDTFPQQWILYDPGTKRFFASNTSLNRIDVFDATTESLLGQITVPGAWVGDITPDHKTIYMGTQVGDLYEIDPVTMTVKARIPAVQIGPAGFAVYEARVMADGKLAVLGFQGGIPSVDGYGELGIWDPTDNSLTRYATAYSGGGRLSTPPICSFLQNIAQMTLTADRQRVLLGSHASDGTLCSFDPSTGDEVTVQTFQSLIGVRSILVPPDGSAILVPSRTTVTVYDATGLFKIDEFQIGNEDFGFYWYMLSLDGNTLFAAPSVPFLYGQPLLAYDWRTHVLKGVVPTFTIHDIDARVAPMAVDETGLIVGVLGEGVGFLDAGTLLPPQASPTSPLFAFTGVVQPTFGPVQGGTQTLLSGLATPQAVNVYFGNQFAPIVSQGSLGVASTAPPGKPGPVNVGVTFTNGGLALFPESYSYGPSIVQVTPDSSTAEGGGTGMIYGYGFGTPDTVGKMEPGLQLSVGGRPVVVTAYSGIPYFDSIPYCCAAPIESLQFTWPPGVAGTSVDISVSGSAGSTTRIGAGHYLPGIQEFPLPGAALIQGIYDARRDLYYFTDASKIQVFSKHLGTWLAPIPIPNAIRLWGISLSPDGSKLAVSDPGSGLIHVVNPDSPSSVNFFSLPNTGADQGGYPGGLAITDSGIIYYNAFYLLFTGGPALHKLDTTTGIVTHYDSQAGALGADAYAKLLLTSDNARLFFNLGGLIFALNTATDTVSWNQTAIGVDYELALSSNQTRMTGGEYLLDTNLNPESYLVLNVREIWNQVFVYGEKLSPDGNLLFAPTLNGIDVFDGRMGTLRSRIALPVTLCPNYDALVANGRDNVLIAITGLNGDGVAVIDLNSLPEPLPLPYPSLISSDVNFGTFAGKSTGKQINRSILQLRAKGTSGIEDNQKSLTLPAPMQHMIVSPRF